MCRAATALLLGCLRLAAARNVLRIGTATSVDLGTVTGGVGRAHERGYDVAMEMLPREVLIGGEFHELQLLVSSGPAREGDFRRAVKGLVDSGVGLFLGPDTSELSLVVAQEVESSGGVVVSPGALDPAIFKGRERVFGLSPPAAAYAPPALDVLSARGAKSLSYVVEEGWGDGNEICQPAEQHASARGLTFHSGQSITQESITSVVTQLQAENPDVVMACVHTRELCTHFVLRLYAESFNPKALLLTSECHTALLSLPPVREGSPWLGYWALGIFPQYPPLPLPFGQELISFSSLLQETREMVSFDSFLWTYQRLFGQQAIPTSHSWAGFHALLLTVLAAQLAGSAEPRAVAAALRGNFSFFDDAGMSTQVPDILQYFNKGLLKTVAPLERAASPMFYPKHTWDDGHCFDPAPSQGQGMGLTALNSCKACSGRNHSVYDTALGYRLCQEFTCRPGQRIITDASTSKLVCADCSPGRIRPLVPSSKLANYYAAESCELCPEGKYQNASAQTACIDCPAGKFQGVHGASICLHCQQMDPSLSTVYYNDKVGAQACQPCPKGAHCPAQDGLYTSVVSADGYYILEEGGETSLHWCPHGKGEACMAGRQCYRDPDTGEEAMQGPFCGKCQEGYGRLVAMPFSICGKCTGLFESMLGLLGLLLIMSLVVGSVLAIIFMTDFSQSCTLKSIIVKQFFNYIQMATTVTQRLEVVHHQRWLAVLSLPELLSQFSGLSVFQNSIHQFSALCFSEMAFPSWKYYHIVQVVGLVWVPIIVLIICGAFGLSRLTASRMGYPMPSRRRLATLVIVTLFFLVQQVTEMNLASWFCHHYDVPRLVVDPSVRCFSSEVMKWQVMGAIGCVIYSFGIPLAFYLILLHHRRKGLLEDPDVLQVFGFFTTGFEPNYWYFECVYMLRKVVFILVLRLPGLSSNDQEQTAIIQNTIMAWASGVFFAMQVFFQPYDNRGYFILDKIETASMLAITLTPMLSLWAVELRSAFVVSQIMPPEALEMIFLLLIAFLHGRVLLLILWGLMQGRLIRYVQQCDGSSNYAIRRLKKLLPKGIIRPYQHGIELVGVDGEAWRLLIDLFGGIFTLHMGERGSVTYEGIAATLQKVMVEAMCLRRIEEVENQNPLRFILRRWKKRVARLPVPCVRGILESLITRLENRLRDRGFKVSHPKGVEVGAEEGRSTRGASTVRGEARCTTFDEMAVIKTFGELYSVDEVYATFIRLGPAAYAECSPVRLQQEDCEDDDVPVDYSKSTIRGTTAVRSTAGPGGSVFYDSADRCSSAALSQLQVLESQLRAANAESEALRAELQSQGVASEKSEEPKARKSAEGGDQPSEETCSQAPRASYPLNPTSKAKGAEEGPQKGLLAASPLSHDVIPEVGESPAASDPASLARGSSAAPPSAVGSWRRAVPDDTGLRQVAADWISPADWQMDEGDSSREGSRVSSKGRLTDRLSTMHDVFMQEEIQRLRRCRQEADMAKEQAECLVGHLQCELRQSRLRCEELEKRAEQSEARVEMLSASNANWRRHAEKSRGAAADLASFDGGLLHCLQDAGTVVQAKEDPQPKRSGSEPSSRTPAESAFLGSLVRRN